MEPIDIRIARRLRLEARAQAEEAEQEAAAHHAATIDLAEAIAQWGEQGRLLRFELGGRTLVGRVLHVGADLVTVRSDAMWFDVAVDALEFVCPVDGDRLPRAVTRGHPGTLVARLREHATLERRVVVGLAGGAERQGVVFAVAGDHLVLRDPDALLPLGRISCCSTDR